MRVCMRVRVCMHVCARVRVRVYHTQWGNALWGRHGGNTVDEPAEWSHVRDGALDGDLVAVRECRNNDNNNINNNNNNNNKSGMMRMMRDASDRAVPCVCSALLCTYVLYTQ